MRILQLILRLSTATAIVVFLYLLLSVKIIPIMGVDAILTSDLIKQTSYEDRKEMNGNIRRFMTPSAFLISAAGFVCIANLSSLYFISREKKNGD